MLKKRNSSAKEEEKTKEEDKFECWHFTTDSVFTYDKEPEETDTPKTAKESPSPVNTYSSPVAESSPKSKDVVKKDELSTRVDELFVVGYCLDGVCGTLSSAQDAVENACCDCGSPKAKVENVEKAPTPEFLKKELRRGPVTKTKKERGVPTQLDEDVDETTSTMVIEPVPSHQPSKRKLRLPFVKRLFGRRKPIVC